jgi:hypothetical protein
MQGVKRVTGMAPPFVLRFSVLNRFLRKLR